MNKLNFLITVSIFLLFTLSCSSLMKGKEVGEKGVKEFHDLYNEKKFAEIYSNSDSVFKEATTQEKATELFEAVHKKLGQVTKQEKATELFEAVHKKLGQVTKSESISWNVNANTSGTFATIVCKTQFGQSEGEESFVFRLNGDEAKLAGYNIQSNDLITK